MVDVKTRSKARGAIVGTAIGDAFGMPLEGLSPATIAGKFGAPRSMVAPIEGTWAHKTHKLRRGQWTDDTQLMLAIGESVVAKGFLDFDDIARRHVLCLDDPRGWGRSTLTGIGRIKTGVDWWNSAAPDGAGNGTPMKIAPIGILLALGRIKRFEAVTAIVNISRMTHGDPRPAVAGVIQADAIAKAIIHGTDGLYSAIMAAQALAEIMELSMDEPHDAFHISLSWAISKAVGMVKEGRTLSEIRADVGAQSFVVQSFPFMLAAVLKYRDDPEACLIELAAQGGDADTTCAMAGALLGAAHGLSSFPERWRRPLEGYGRLLAMADGLCELLKSPSLNDATQTGSHQRPRIMFKRTSTATSPGVPK